MEKGFGGRGENVEGVEKGRQLGMKRKLERGSCVSFREFEGRGSLSGLRTRDMAAPNLGG